MAGGATRRERLEELLDIAQAYRGWNRRQLAAALGRDPSNLVPASGSPKIDLVIGLAGALEWSIEDVVRSFWVEPRGALAVSTSGHVLPDARPDARPDAPPDAPPGAQTGSRVPNEREPAGSFAELEQASRAAAREGRHVDAVKLAGLAGSRARTSEERAIACTREASGWDGLGRYRLALDASKRGLLEHDVSADRRRIIQVNLANEYYTLWHPQEARALAHELVTHYETQAPLNRPDHVSCAFAYYVRGHSNRRLIAIDRRHQRQHARAARADLDLAERLFLELGERYEDDAYRGIANTCRGGIIEATVVVGERDAECALAEFSTQLDAIVDPDHCGCGDWLESYGWWCIYACNIVMRHLSDERRIQQHLAVFTNKADEIAERTNNWAMRERIVTMEYARRRRFADWTGMTADWTMDEDDVRAIAGTMGRFPAFHETGWEVLRSASIVQEPERNGSARRLGAT